jgi:hypothetical protein
MAISGTPQIPAPSGKCPNPQPSWYFSRTGESYTTISALAVELLIRSRDARKGNDFSHALRGMAILVRGLRFDGDISPIAARARLNTPEELQYLWTTTKES